MSAAVAVFICVLSVLKTSRASLSALPIASRYGSMSCRAIFKYERVTSCMPENGKLRAVRWATCEVASGFSQRKPDQHASSDLLAPPRATLQRYNGWIGYKSAARVITCTKPASQHSHACPRTWSSSINCNVRLLNSYFPFPNEFFLCTTIFIN